VGVELYLKQDEVEAVFKSHIKSGVYSLSIKTLFGDRMSRKIKYDPYYQRNYVWDKRKASFFIESILLGTDVPPLIFFNMGSVIEVIDGRQRYETIKRFRAGELKLQVKGLTKLTQLAGRNFSQLDPDIQELFDDAKIRIFEFEVFNEPRMDSSLEDKIKKEIFRRYNSGITPLNSAEIDNAKYDDDQITNDLRRTVTSNKKLFERVADKFMGQAGDDVGSKIHQFLRRYLVLTSFPINTYATGSGRTEILELLYDVKAQNTENTQEVCEFLIEILSVTLDLIDNLSGEHNRSLNEALLWGIFVLKEEGKCLSRLRECSVIQRLKSYLTEHKNDFLSENSHHYKSIIARHESIGNILGDIFDCSYALYIRDDDFKNEVKDLKQSEKEAKLKLEELSSLRVQKPEPSLIPIEEIASELCGSKYLIRPSYQRQEKINVYKASAIMESIILGVNLPPLFIFKRKDGVKEVIDGQQRLLSVLGFLGRKYQDETGQLIYPKNTSFKLKGLKILKEHDGHRYTDLTSEAQDKILDFKLSVIEIDAALNENFEPVDLFIRLNNKPYPIKENSFEMWNSFIDKEIIQSLKDVTRNNKDWFYIKLSKTSDRMLNEELITLLSYIVYNTKYRPDYTSLGYYLRDEKITCRLVDKKDVSLLLEKISVDFELKESFLECVKEVDDLISILKFKVGVGNPKDELNGIFGRDTQKRYLVDFYILFQIMQSLTKDRLRSMSYKELKSKMSLIKGKMQLPDVLEDGDTHQKYFEKMLSEVSS